MDEENIRTLDKIAQRLKLTAMTSVVLTYRLKQNI